MKLDKSYKIRVNPEQSRQIQKLVFALGGDGWYGNEHLVQYTERPFFYVDSVGRMHANHSEEHFNCICCSDYTEIQADDLIALLTNLSKSDTEIDTSANSVDDAPHVSYPSNDDAPHAKFKIGDPVYWANDVEGKIHKLGQYLDGAGWRLNNSSLFVSECLLCHATPENHALLCKLYPHIQFEAPPTPLTGSDLARAMFDAGHEYVVGKVGNHVGVYYTWSEGAGHFFEVCGTGAFDIEPIDPRTGEPLTEAVLDE